MPSGMPDMSMTGTYVRVRPASESQIRSTMQDEMGGAGLEPAATCVKTSAIEGHIGTGAPEGVPVNAPISVCSPRLLDIDVTNP
jgi:hypothetical protein